MTVSTTPRFGAKKYSSGGDPHPDRTEYNALIDLIENNGGMYSQGITGARPAAGKRGRWYWDETVSRMFYDNGTAWLDTNPNGGGGAGAAIVPGAAAAEGTSPKAARADHTHALALATGAVNGAMPATDKAKLDAATSAATAGTLALRDSGGRLSVNTPTDAGHAATMAYVDGALVQAADYTDAKVNAGATPTELSPLAVTGYTLTGKIYVERLGAFNRVTVDINITRTASDITINTVFSSFGAVVPAGARGTAVTKFLPVSLTEGGNNGHATVKLTPADGVLMIRGVTAFTWTTGAVFSLNATYLVPAS